jgi:RNA recognition motif-containing protein
VRIYAGNLSYNTTKEQITELFEEYGEVRECLLLVDRETQQSKGTAFIEMSDRDGAGAIEHLNAQQFGGRKIRVSIAKPRPSGNRTRRPE